MKFRALEVHTLHIRDFNGERIVQSLGEIREYEISMACAEREVQALLFPAKRIITKCLPFFLLTILGLALSFLLTFGEFLPALRAIGPIAFLVGLTGIAGKVRESLRERDSVSKMNHDEAVKYSAWTLVLRQAPKKSGDNDVTYIPLNDETERMSAEELAEKYNLLSAIARQVNSTKKERP